MSFWIFTSPLKSVHNKSMLFSQQKLTFCRFQDLYRRSISLLKNSTACGWDLLNFIHMPITVIHCGFYLSKSASNPSHMNLTLLCPIHTLQMNKMNKMSKKVNKGGNHNQQPGSPAIIKLQLHIGSCSFTTTGACRLKISGKVAPHFWPRSEVTQILPEPHCTGNQSAACHRRTF